MICVGGPCDGQQVAVRPGHALVVEVIPEGNLRAFLDAKDAEAMATTTHRYTKRSLTFPGQPAIDFLAPSDVSTIDAIKPLLSP